MSPPWRRATIVPVNSDQVFEILVRENADMLWAFLLSATRDPVTAEDLVQEAFTVAWRNLDRYDRRLPFGPWLRGIAGKLLLAHGRKSRRSKLYFCDGESLELLEGEFTRFDSLRGDTWQDKLEALRSCLSRLDAPRREVIELHYERGLNCRQIAERMGKGFEAIKKHLQRGRAALLACIRTRLGLPPDAAMADLLPDGGDLLADGGLEPGLDGAR
jgi:RNA polymerase sigma-70 factor (ECF subfamily)